MNIGSEIAGRTAPASRPNFLSVTGLVDPEQPHTDLQMSDGRILHLPTSLLLEAQVMREPIADDSQDLPVSETELIIPLLEERLEVGKRTVVTGSLRLEKTVQEYSQSLDEVLAVRTFDIERVILNQPVESAPPIRQEGNVTVYSLVEEQLILTKQLILKEEIRIVQRDTERQDTQIVTLHKEHMTVERETQV